MFGLSNWWLLTFGVPYFLALKFDNKFVPYSEIENFYKYVYERRKAETYYKVHNKGLEEDLNKIDSNSYNQIKNELLKANSTLYEAVQDLDESYLLAAINSVDK